MKSRSRTRSEIDGAMTMGMTIPEGLGNDIRFSGYLRLERKSKTKSAISGGSGEVYSILSNVNVERERESEL